MQKSLSFAVHYAGGWQSVYARCESHRMQRTGIKNGAQGRVWCCWLLMHASWQLLRRCRLCRRPSTSTSSSSPRASCWARTTISAESCCLKSSYGIRLVQHVGHASGLQEVKPVKVHVNDFDFVACKAPCLVPVECVIERTLLRLPCFLSCGSAVLTLELELRCRAPARCSTCEHGCLS